MLSEEGEGSISGLVSPQHPQKPQIRATDFSLPLFNNNKTHTLPHGAGALAAAYRLARGGGPSLWEVKVGILTNPV